MVPSKDKHAGAGGRIKKDRKDKKADKGAKRRRARQAVHSGSGKSSGKHKRDAAEKKRKKGAGSVKDEGTRKKHKRDKEKRARRDAKRGKEKSARNKGGKSDARGHGEGRQAERPASSEEIGTGSEHPVARDAGIGSARDRRQQMIAETAYYIAERRGLSGGDPEQDWLEAERQVDRRLRGES
jgi:hypothetical protein